MPEINRILLRALPKIDDVLRTATVQGLLNQAPRGIVVETVRAVVDGVRREILAGTYLDSSGEMLFRVVAETVEQVQRAVQPNLRSVINATGVVLHTNLGRALLAASASRAVQEAAAKYCNLEIDLDSGRRGSRYAPLEELLTKLTGAEAALVVNNNAAAVLLALSTMARSREVIVSRGQLVEIGGSFRIPEVMSQSGARLVEVGATNKTHPADYRQAVTPETALLLHVHTSNYRIVGFTRETTVAELVAIGREQQLPVMSDLGSGFLVDLSPYGLPYEPTVQETVAAGADVVTFSGDKLLGGPQAGIIVGKKIWLDQMKKNPLTRAVRINKFTVAALEATLREYLDPVGVFQNIPTLQMLTLPLRIIEERAGQLKEAVLSYRLAEVAVTVCRGISQVGGGSMPTAELPTSVVTVKADGCSPDQLAGALRLGIPAVVGRVQDDALCFDLRTVQPEEISLLAGVLVDVINRERGGGH